ncbi:MAG: DUF4292 domain-containing protein [Cytophagaceae bacterium]|nr:DUF4292 domain-containing protein [Cytophagaceae bacterium]
MSRPLFLGVIFFSLFFSSCKRQKIQTSEKPTLPSCNVEEIDFTYFSTKSKLDYKDKQNDLKSNIHIRAKKDSIIWISINAAAGFEAIRCLIKTDSVHILDRLNNTYTVLDYPSLSNQIGVDLSYAVIQNMILGNLIYPKTPEDVVMQSDSNSCVFIQKSRETQITNYIRVANSKVEKVEATTAAANKLSIRYLNFVPLGRFGFASKNEIEISIKVDAQYQTTKIEIDHHKAEIPEKELNFPFNVPQKFIRK